MLFIFAVLNIKDMAKGKTAKGSRSTGRPKPMAPKAGVTKKVRRYGCGGKLK